MRIENLKDKIGQFPDIDGFWTTPNLNEVEINIKAAIPDKDLIDILPSHLDAFIQMARLYDIQGKTTEASQLISQIKNQLSVLQKTAALAVQSHLPFFLFFSPPRA